MTTVIDRISGILDIDVDIEDEVILVTVMGKQTGQESSPYPRVDPELAAQGVVCKITLTADGLEEAGKKGLRICFGPELLHPSVSTGDVVYSIEDLRNIPLYAEFTDGRLNGTIMQLEAVLDTVPEEHKMWGVSTSMCFCLPMSYLLSPIIAGEVNRASVDLK